MKRKSNKKNFNFNGGSSSNSVINHPKINLNKYKYAYHITNKDFLWELGDIDKDIFLTVSKTKKNINKVTSEEDTYLGYHSTGFIYRKITYLIDFSQLNIGKLDKITLELDKIRDYGIDLGSYTGGRGSVFDRYSGKTKKQIHDLYFPKISASEPPESGDKPYDGYFDSENEIVFLKITSKNKQKINNAIKMYYVHYTDECYDRLLEERNFYQELIKSPDIMSLTKPEFKKIIKELRKEVPCLKRFFTVNKDLLLKINSIISS